MTFASVLSGRGKNPCLVTFDTAVKPVIRGTPSACLGRGHKV